VKKNKEFTFSSFVFVGVAKFKKFNRKEKRKEK
jgi:hypothetical protein